MNLTFINDGYNKAFATEVHSFFCVKSHSINCSLIYFDSKNPFKCF